MKGIVALLLSTLLFSHDNNFVDIQAKIFPQIILFDTKINDKKIHNSVEIIVTGEAHSVTLFVKMASEYYQAMIKDTHIHFVAMKPSDIDKKTPMSALIFLGDDGAMIRNLSGIASEKNILMFVDDPLSFRFGGAVSLEVRNKVKPLLNSKVMKENRVIFSSGFIALARIVNE